MATSTIKLPPAFRVVAQTGTANETYAQKMAELQSAYNTLSNDEKSNSFLMYSFIPLSHASASGQYSRIYSFYSSASQKYEIEIWVCDIPRAKITDWNSRSLSSTDISEQTTSENFKLCVRM